MAVLPLKQPKPSDVSRVLQSVASDIETSFKSHIDTVPGFCMFVFANGRVEYVSNSSDRREIKAAMLAILDGWDKGMPDIPAHKLD